MLLFVWVWVRRSLVIYVINGQNEPSFHHHRDSCYPHWVTLDPSRIYRSDSTRRTDNYHHSQSKTRRSTRPFRTLTLQAPSTTQRFLIKHPSGHIHVRTILQAFSSASTRFSVGPSNDPPLLATSYHNVRKSSLFSPAPFYYLRPRSFYRSGLPPYLP